MTGGLLKCPPTEKKFLEKFWGFVVFGVMGTGHLIIQVFRVDLSKLVSNYY